MVIEKNSYDVHYYITDPYKRRVLDIISDK